MGRVGDGESVGRVGDGESVGRVGDGESVDRVGDGESVGRVGDGESVGRVGDGESVGRVGDVMLHTHPHQFLSTPILRCIVSNIIYEHNLDLMIFCFNLTAKISIRFLSALWLKY